MRRHKAEEHSFAPDARYNSELVTHLINIIMNRGKKSTAQRKAAAQAAKAEAKPARKASAKKRG